MNFGGSGDICGGVGGGRRAAGAVARGVRGAGRGGALFAGRLAPGVPAGSRLEGRREAPGVSRWGRGALGGGRRRRRGVERRWVSARDGPGPVAGQAQGGAPGVAGDPPGLVEQAVAQALELPGAGLVCEQQLPGPGHEVLGELNEP